MRVFMFKLISNRNFRLKEMPLTGLFYSFLGSHFFWSVACDLQSLPAIVSLQRGTSQTEETT